MCIYWTSIKRTNLTNNLNDKQDSTPCTQLHGDKWKRFIHASRKKNAQKNSPFKKTPPTTLSRKVIAQQTGIFSQS